jgi:hypothetical protein
MKKKNYKCCGMSYKKINPNKFSKKCLNCKKGGQNNKHLICMHEDYLGIKNDKNAKIRVQNTAYCKDYMNYIITCKECFIETEEYWKERWDEYYSQIL